MGDPAQRLEGLGGLQRRWWAGTLGAGGWGLGHGKQIKPETRGRHGVRERDTRNERAGGIFVSPCTEGLKGGRSCAQLVLQNHATHTANPPTYPPAQYAHTS